MTSNEFVDKIRPEHDRTTCDDERLVNGFGSGDSDDDFRCLRCALMEIANGSKEPPDLFTVVGAFM